MTILINSLDRPPSKGATYASVCPGNWDQQAPPGAASPACHRLQTGPEHNLEKMVG